MAKIFRINFISIYVVFTPPHATQQQIESKVSYQYKIKMSRHILMFMIMILTRFEDKNASNIERGVYLEDYKDC